MSRDLSSQPQPQAPHKKHTNNPKTTKKRLDSQKARLEIAMNTGRRRSEPSYSSRRPSNPQQHPPRSRQPRDERDRRGGSRGLPGGFSSHQPGVIHKPLSQSLGLFFAFCFDSLFLCVDLHARSDDVGEVQKWDPKLENHRLFRKDSTVLGYIGVDPPHVSHGFETIPK